jgi:hypothetical protein
LNINTTVPLDKKGEKIAFFKMIFLIFCLTHPVRGSGTTCLVQRRRNI